MDYFVAPLSNLIDQFQRLPGVGPKTAGRMAFFVLSLPEKEAEDFANAITTAKREIRLCSVCQNLTDNAICGICQNPDRNNSIICVMESPKDVISLERTREYNGLYHVLHGAISPMEKVSPEDIKIKELLTRLRDETVREVIMATNLSVEGEATAVYISRLIKPLGIRVTRIARGLPVGGDLEYADEMTLTRAIEGRLEM